MSGRLLTSGLAPIARRAPGCVQRRLAHNHALSKSAGLLRTDSFAAGLKQRSWPLGSSAIHNAPAVRQISIVRNIPSLFLKLLRLPALFGGAGIAGLAYIQYQANQAGAYAVDIFHQGTNAASTFAGQCFDGLSNAAEQTRRGWDKTKLDVRESEWMQRIMNGEEASTGSSGPGGRGSKNHKESSMGGGGGGGAAAGATTAAALGTTVGLGDDRSEVTAAQDDQMMVLTKKMIEIRGLLQQVGQGSALTLPSIVVVGSQSSGKSSVLEAIVGHEFLPKGSNMVTRRPIELTLVNTPDAHAEYGEFPALGLGKITDFSQVQKTLRDLNLAVPEKDCVSDDPIQLRIYSPRVPDLSMIDLPGYIQVSGFDQPTELKTRISELCDKYIKAPNIILAVSAADVDLANSTSLRASRRADPRGERTIGVITKMDLVDPGRGHDLLTDRKYPLRLGYVGVVSKVPQAAGLFHRGNADIINAIIKNENAFFSTHKEFGPDSETNVGTSNLRKKLMRVLEQSMSASLVGTTSAIHNELAEANYEYKVQYNERPLSAESYLAESLDTFKHSFKSFSEQFGRDEVRRLLKHELDQQVLNLLAQRYWNKPEPDLANGSADIELLNELPKASIEDSIWQHKLEASRSALTKLGIGRLAAGVVASSLQSRVEDLIQQSSFSVHPFAKQAITESCSDILRDLSYDTADELEICIKPYKYRTDIDDSDWARGRSNVGNILKEELKTCEDAFVGVEREVGGKSRLKDVIGFIDRARNGDVVLEGDGAGGAGGFSAALLRKGESLCGHFEFQVTDELPGREAVFLRDRADIIRMRIKAVKSKQCGNKKNIPQCPEVFLDAVADRLTNTADFFLDAELLAKFYYLFPRELDARLGRNLSPADIERFAREDPKIRRHLDVVKRKELLELVLKETESLRLIEGRERRSRDGQSQQRSTRRSWSLF
ncbi:MAG: hypothetical protein Q9162_002752 [Coniocarpon cinnabarinum]